MTVKRVLYVWVIGMVALGSALMGTAAGGYAIYQIVGKSARYNLTNA